MISAPLTAFASEDAARFVPGLSSNCPLCNNFSPFLFSTTKRNFSPLLRISIFPAITVLLVAIWDSSLCGSTPRRFTGAGARSLRERDVSVRDGLGWLAPSAALLSCRVPPGSESGELVVEQGQTVDGHRPAVMVALSLGSPPACDPLLLVGGGRDEHVGEAVLVVGRDQPARLAVGDDFRRSVCAAGDHGQPAGHRLDQHQPERLADRGQHEQVGGVQRLRELLVRAPAGKEDLPVPEPAGGGERMLALPLTGMAAYKHERQGAAEPLERARVRGDQQRQSLDRRVAADIEEDRAAGPEGSELLLAIGDAAGAAALAPALGLLDQPAPPERKPLLAGNRPRPERFEVD